MTEVTPRHGPRDGMKATVEPRQFYCFYPALNTYEEPMRHTYAGQPGNSEFQYIGLFTTAATSEFEGNL
jgi:hypothetical protein